MVTYLSVGTVAVVQDSTVKSFRLMTMLECFRIITFLDKINMA